MRRQIIGEDTSDGLFYCDFTLKNLERRKLKTNPNRDYHKNGCKPITFDAYNI